MEAHANYIDTPPSTGMDLLDFSQLFGLPEDQFNPTVSEAKTEDIFKSFDFEAFSFDNGEQQEGDSASSSVGQDSPASERTREMSSASENSIMLGTVISPPETPLQAVGGLCLDFQTGIQPYQLSACPTDFGGFGFNLDSFLPSTTTAEPSQVEPSLLPKGKRSFSESESVSAESSPDPSIKPKSKRPKIAAPAKKTSRIQALIKASNESEAARLVGVTPSELRDVTRFPSWESLFAAAPTESHAALNKIRERQDVGRTQQREYALQARIKKDNALVQVPLLEAEIEKLKKELEGVKKEKEEMRGKFSRVLGYLNGWFGSGRISMEEFSEAVL